MRKTLAAEAASEAVAEVAVVSEEAAGAVVETSDPALLQAPHANLAKMPRMTYM